MSSIPSLERTVAWASLVNGALGAAVGALVDGLTGAMIGMVIGLALAVLPIVVRASLAWLAAPQGLPRFVARQVAAGAVTIGQSLLDGLLAVCRPIGRLLFVPLLVVRFLVDVARRAGATLATVAWRLIANPLGLANLAALGVIAVNLTGFEFAGPIALLGLGMLVLVLMVSVNEARDAQTAARPGREG